MGYNMGKCELFLLMLKIILSLHKVGICLHGHIWCKVSQLSEFKLSMKELGYMNLEHNTTQNSLLKWCMPTTAGSDQNSEVFESLQRVMGPYY